MLTSSSYPKPVSDPRKTKLLNLNSLTSVSIPFADRSTAFPAENLVELTIPSANECGGERSRECSMDDDGHRQGVKRRPRISVFIRSVNFREPNLPSIRYYRVVNSGIRSRAGGDTRIVPETHWERLLRARRMLFRGILGCCPLSRRVQKKLGWERLIRHAP
jgi:hypothetical protein